MAWIGGALSLGGALLQSDSAEDAASSQDAATREALQEQRRQYDLNRSDLSPYRKAGGAAINRLSELLSLGSDVNSIRLPNGQSVRDATIKTINDEVARSNAAGNAYNAPFEQQGEADQETLLNQFRARVLTANNIDPNNLPATPDSGSLTKKFTLADFWDDPVTKASYQFGLDEGTKALDRMGGAKGMRNSGAQLKALSRYATDYTGQQAGQSQARFVNDQTNLYNRLAGVAGTGQNAANTTVASGTNMANTVGGMLTAQGNARGAASIAGGNAVGGALTGAGNWYNQQRTLNQILNRGGTAGAGAPSGGGNVGDDWF